MVNCAVYRFHNMPMRTALHGENMKSSDVHIPGLSGVNVRVKRMSGVRGEGEQ